jgi:hypothetical protein
MYALSGLGYKNKVISFAGLPLLLDPPVVTVPGTKANCVGLASPDDEFSFLLKFINSVLDILLTATSVVLLSPSKLEVAPAVVVTTASTISITF